MDTAEFAKFAGILLHHFFFFFFKEIFILGFLVAQTGEGNGNPLQHSCLENPMDGGAWWAAVHGVAKSRHD